MEKDVDRFREDGYITPVLFFTEEEIESIDWTKFDEFYEIKDKNLENDAVV